MSGSLLFDMDCLLDLSGGIVGLRVYDFNVVSIDLMSCPITVFKYGRAGSGGMFLDTGAKSSGRFTDVVCCTVLTLNIKSRGKESDSQ